MPVVAPRPDLIKRITLDDIKNEYHDGRITASERNRLVRAKAKSKLEETIENKGFIDAVLNQTVEHLNQGWEDFTKATDTFAKAMVERGEPAEKAKEQAIAIAKSFWGEIQMLSSFFNAVGEVVGSEVETSMRASGASPGVAKVVGIAADLGSGMLIPVGTLSKSFARTVQAVGKRYGAKVAGKAAEKAPEAAADVEKVMTVAMGEGLKVEGAAPGIAENLFKGTATEVVTDVTQQAAKIVSSIKDEFASSFAKFKTEVTKLTERQTREETVRMARSLNISIDDLRNVVPGQALDAPQMWTYLKALEPIVTKVKDGAKAVVKEGTDAAVHAFARDMQEFFTLAPIFRGAEATSGRAVEVLKEAPDMKQITNMVMGWDPAKIAQGDFTGAVKTLADDIVAMSDKQVSQFGIISQSYIQKFRDDYWPMARETYLNLLLMRPAARVRDFISNATAMTLTSLERGTGSLFTIDKAEGLVSREILYDTKGMFFAMGDAIKAFGRAFREIDPADMTKLDFPNIGREIPGALGRIVNVPLATTVGVDNFFKVLNRRGGYYGIAVRDGVHKGLTGHDLEEFVARRVNFPTKDMITEAGERALNNTFQNELGTFGKNVRNVLQHGPFVMYWPFMKTPINLAKFAWHRAPGLQLFSEKLYSDVLAGGARADEAIGRLTISNLMGMFLFEAAKEGLITGSGPVDKELRQEWLRRNQPYSVKLPDGSFIGISSGAPADTVIGQVADFVQVIDQLDEPTAQQGAMAIAFSIIQNMADKTYWQTIDQLVDVISTTEAGQFKERGWKFLTAPAVNIATGGTLTSAIAKAQDPIQRETRGFIDEIMARTPGYSKTLPPVRDGFGDKVLTSQAYAVGGATAGIFHPVNLKPGETDPIKLEAARLLIRLPQFDWTIGGTATDEFDIRAPKPGEQPGVDLTPQERDRWISIYGKLLRHPEMGLQKQLLDNKFYQDARIALQREMYHGLLADYKTSARDILIATDPNLARRLLEVEKKRVGSLLGEQESATIDIPQTLDLLETLTPEETENLLRWGPPGGEE